MIDKMLHKMIKEKKIVIFIQLVLNFLIITIIEATIK